MAPAWKGLTQPLGKRTYGLSRKRSYGLSRKRSYGLSRKRSYGLSRKRSYGTVKHFSPLWQAQRVVCDNTKLTEITILPHETEGWERVQGAQCSAGSEFEISSH